jgi:hypothetical protein
MRRKGHRERGLFLRRMLPGSLTEEPLGVSVHVTARKNAAMIWC